MRQQRGTKKIAKAKFHPLMAKISFILKSSGSVLPDNQAAPLDYDLMLKQPVKLIGYIENNNVFIVTGPFLDVIHCDKPALTYIKDKNVEIFTLNDEQVKVVDEMIYTELFKWAHSQQGLASLFELLQQTLDPKLSIKLYGTNKLSQRSFVNSHGMTRGQLAGRLATARKRRKVPPPKGEF